MNHQSLFYTKLISIAICLLFSVNNNSFSNGKGTIRPGDIFPDTQGAHINAHGGGILHHKGVYYWYGEHKGKKDNNAWVGVTCYSSPDIATWKNEGVALSVVDEVGHEIESGCIIERPKVIYNKKTKKFVMYFHLELKNQGYKAARVGIAVSDSPIGPFQFLKSYRPNAGCYPINFTQAQKKSTVSPAHFPKSWTPEWKEAVKEGMFLRRDLQGGQMSRDMTLFVDDDNTAYHIYSSEENGTLHIAELTKDYLNHTGKYMRMAPGGFNEAPAIFKHKNTYWMITSDCTGWNPNAARLFKSSSMWGPWEQLPNPCVGQEAETTFRSQSTFILTKKTKNKTTYIYMGDRWTPDNPIDGRYIWLPIQFNKQGIPFLEWSNEWNVE